MHRRISQCRICGNQRLRTVLDLGVQALTGRFPLPDEPDPTAGPLELLRCEGDPRDACGLLQLSYTYELSEMYGPTYGYRSALSQSMVRHLSELVESAVALAQPGPGDAVLDIGCNDGTLLKFYEGLALERVGIDPSSARFADAYPPDVRLLVDFFSGDRVRAACGDRRFKVITSIAMFYDIDDPIGFMREVRDLLAPDGVWVFEQGYAARMIENVAYDSVCHEHLNYYNLRQIQWMAERAGLRILDVEVNDVNGASFCVTAARDDASFSPRATTIDALAAAERGLEERDLYDRFRVSVEQSRDTLRAFVDRALGTGRRIYGCGASTKGNVVIQYCGLGPDQITAIAEKHPGKHGHVTPGSRIPIVTEAEARAARPDYFLVFPWHYRAEITRREQRFVEGGGTLVFPLPRFELVGGTPALERVA